MSYVNFTKRITNKKGQNAWNQIVRNKTRINTNDVDFMSEIEAAATTYKSFLRAAEAYLMEDLMAIENGFKNAKSKYYPTVTTGAYRFMYNRMMRMVARNRRTLAFVQMQLSKL